MYVKQRRSQRPLPLPMKSIPVDGQHCPKSQHTQSAGPPGQH
jgi:hypothetical protein